MGEMQIMLDIIQWQALFISIRFLMSSEQLYKSKHSCRQFEVLNKLYLNWLWSSLLCKYSFGIRPSSNSMSLRTKVCVRYKFHSMVPDYTVVLNGYSF